ncbi:hypothetical protein GGR57DRAFT_321827 [Xylariaceae sp. FL1272]|nr:hypothetical protein GGR57DRAFT_321827 [Xylariaceae sp. FL1272]
MYWILLGKILLGATLVAAYIVTQRVSSDDVLETWCSSTSSDSIARFTSHQGQFTRSSINSVTSLNTLRYLESEPSTHSLSHLTIAKIIFARHQNECVDWLKRAGGFLGRGDIWSYVWLDSGSLFGSRIVGVGFCHVMIVQANKVDI